MLNQTVVPSPHSLSTQIVPPCASTVFLQIYSPSPVPAALPCAPDKKLSEQIWFYSIGNSLPGIRRRNFHIFLYPMHRDSYNAMFGMPARVGDQVNQNLHSTKISNAIAPAAVCRPKRPARVFSTAGGAPNAGGYVRPLYSPL